MIARTWILVADAAYARIFELSEENRHWVLVKEFEHLEGREQGHDLMGNRPYKIQHQMEMTDKNENPVEFKHQQMTAFTLELMRHLEQEFFAQKFDQLALVAAPKMLGTLREKLTPTLKKLVVVEIAKDYSKMQPAQMEELVPVF